VIAERRRRASMVLKFAVVRAARRRGEPFDPL
jgi:hypothetical protein